MQIQHVAALLGIMAAYDYRRTDRTDDEAWFEVIGDLEFEDCKTAVIEHYKTSGDRMKPVDVRTKVKALRDERARVNGAPVGAGGSAEIPDADPDDWRAYRAAIREQRIRIGSVLMPRPVAALIAGHPFQDVPQIGPADVRREIRAIEGGAR